MKNKYITGFDGADGYDGINVYASDDADNLCDELIDQIPYNPKLATEKRGYSHIAAASREMYRRYPSATSGDDIIFNNDQSSSIGQKINELK